MNFIIIFCIILAAYFDAGSGAFSGNLAGHNRVARATFGYTTNKPGTCPRDMSSGPMGLCVTTCYSDASCQDSTKCCPGSGQCGRTCQVPSFNDDYTYYNNAGNTAQFSSRLSSAGLFSSRLTDVAVMEDSKYKDGACPDFSVGYTGVQCYGVRDDCSVNNGDADCSGMQKCCLTDCYRTMCKNPIRYSG